MYISMGLRFKVEVEALNMTESVGNYTRHRIAPILYVERDSDGRIKGYRITMAPSISGQSVAYGYMAALVALARGKLNLCEQCENYQKLGGFFKRADKLESHDERVKRCVVEDLTGFMATEERRGEQRGAVVRRTSPVMFSYLVPDAHSARGVIMPQFHVRFNLQNPEQQAPFQIETGTAVYIHGVAIDVDRIGLLEKGEYVDDREERVELALDALKALYGGFLFGAKKARNHPIFEHLGGIAAVSTRLPFNVTPPRFGDYVAENIKRARAYGVSEVALFCFDKEKITSCDGADDVIKTSNLEELIDKVKGYIKNILKK